MQRCIRIRMRAHLHTLPCATRVSKEQKLRTSAITAGFSMMLSKLAELSMISKCTHTALVRQPGRSASHNKQAQFRSLESCAMSDAEAARNAKLARNMFIGGCCLLPWLWVVNLLYYAQAWRLGKLPAEVVTWVRRSAVCAAIESLLFLTWVVAFQIFWRSWGSDIFPYMMLVPKEDLSGW
jgi:Presenilin enhancer-2 subunit of gamma secretase